MVVEIPLKAKYRVGGKGRYKSPYGGDSSTKRKNRTKHLPKTGRQVGEQPKVMAVIGPTGKVRMVRTRN